MEVKKLTPEQIAALRRPLPNEAVKPHPTKTFLSSIKAIYVTERLNEVFGIGAWQTKVDHITTTEKSMVVVKVTFSVPEYGIYYECYGGNDNGGENSKNFDLGDAFKGATTDAITKIGSYLEIGIDVFKGLHGKSSPQTPPATNLPELIPNTEDWTNAVAYLIKNGSDKLPLLEKKKSISKEHKVLLLRQITENVA